MKKRSKVLVVAAVIAAVLLGAMPARADVDLGLAFLFPIPVPVPIYKVEHDPSPVTFGLLFPIPLPVPVYDYGDHKAKEPEEREQTHYGRLQTMVNPRDASLYVDGEYIGESGDYRLRKDALTVRPGTHLVEFKASGYVPYTAEVSVSPGGLVNIRHDMLPSE